MQRTGIIDRPLKKIFRDTDTSKTKLLDLHGLGYEDVAFPFLALLTGLSVALMQLGIETAMFCKKKCPLFDRRSTEEDSASDEAKDIIKDIHDLLVENHCQLGGIKFLNKIRMLSLPGPNHQREPATKYECYNKM